MVFQAYVGHGCGVLRQIFAPDVPCVLVRNNVLLNRILDTTIFFTCPPGEKFIRKIKGSFTRRLLQLHAPVIAIQISCGLTITHSGHVPAGQEKRSAHFDARSGRANSLVERKQ